MDKEVILKAAFDKVINIFNPNITFEKIKFGGNSITIYYVYHRDSGSEFRNTGTFGDYGFNKEEGNKTFKQYNGNLNPDVEELVPSSLDKDEETMAVLRLAARLYLNFKSDGMIK